MASVLARDLVDNGIAVTVDAASDNLSESNSVAETLSGDVRFFGYLKVTNSASPSFTVKIQHSADKETWEDLVSFTAVTGNVTETIFIDPAGVHVMQYVKAVAVYTSGQADVVCKLYYDRDA